MLFERVRRGAGKVSIIECSGRKVEHIIPREIVRLTEANQIALMVES